MYEYVRQNFAIHAQTKKAFSMSFPPWKKYIKSFSFPIFKIQREIKWKPQAVFFFSLQRNPITFIFFILFYALDCSKSNKCRILSRQKTHTYIWSCECICQRLQSLWCLVGAFSIWLYFVLFFLLGNFGTEHVVIVLYTQYIIFFLIYVSPK